MNLFKCIDFVGCLKSELDGANMNNPALGVQSTVDKSTGVVFDPSVVVASLYVRLCYCTTLLNKFCVF